MIINESLDTAVDFYITDDTKMPMEIYGACVIDGTNYGMSLVSTNFEKVYELKFYRVLDKKPRRWSFLKSTHVRPALSTLLKFCEASIPFLKDRMDGIIVPIPGKEQPEKFHRFMQLLIKRTYVKTWRYIPVVSSDKEQAYNHLFIIRKIKSPKTLFASKSFSKYTFPEGNEVVLPVEAAVAIEPKKKVEKTIISLNPSAKFSQELKLSKDFKIDVDSEDDVVKVAADLDIHTEETPNVPEEDKTVIVEFKGNIDKVNASLKKVWLTCSPATLVFSFMPSYLDLVFSKMKMDGNKYPTDDQIDQLVDEFKPYAFFKYLTASPYYEYMDFVFNAELYTTIDNASVETANKIRANLKSLLESYKTELANGKTPQIILSPVFAWKNFMSSLVKYQKYDKLVQESWEKSEKDGKTYEFKPLFLWNPESMERNLALKSKYNNYLVHPNGGGITFTKAKISNGFGTKPFSKIHPKISPQMLNPDVATGEETTKEKVTKDVYELYGLDNPNGHFGKTGILAAAGIKENAASHVKSYSGSSSSDYNNTLRKIFYSNNTDVYIDYLEKIDKLYAAFRQVDPIKKSIKVYRNSDFPPSKGSYSATPESFLKAFPIGSFFFDPAFLSTSINSKVEIGGHELKLRILIPKGSKVVPILGDSHHKGEMEILLPPLSALKIVGHEVKPDTSRIFVDCIFMGTILKDMVSHILEDPKTAWTSKEHQDQLKKLLECSLLQNLIMESKMKNTTSTDKNEKDYDPNDKFNGQLDYSFIKNAETLLKAKKVKIKKV